MEFEALPNPAMNQGGGAGIQAAQFVVGLGAQAVLSGNLGPNAFDVLQAAGVRNYQVPEGTVRQAVEAFKAGRVQPMGGANVAAYAGMGGGAAMGGGRGTGRGMGRGMGGGAGMGGGRGMGRGMGQGMGGGMGRGAGVNVPVQAATPPKAAPEAPAESELAQLRKSLVSLQQQLADTMERIERLETRR
jgi:predicted Fe-Mo cluster-binding NifX family protein